MRNDKITGLAAEACDLKKAWVLGMALVGKPTSIPLSHLNMPSYAHWQAKPLKRQIADLEHGLDEIGKKFILEDWSSVRLNKTVPWLAQKHDEWLAAGQPVYELVVQSSKV